MGGILHAEVSIRSNGIVKVDIEKHAKHYATERAEFDGTDEEFAKQGLREIGVHDLLFSSGEPGDGIEVEIEAENEGDIDIIGVVPA